MKAKIYTKSGDKGETSLVGGTRVTKTNPRLEAYGTLDELNSHLGVLRSQLGATFANLDGALQTVQNNLFNIGSHLACESEEFAKHLPGLWTGSCEALETQMDTWEAELPPLRNFILPGGSPLAALAHVARTVCRRAERDTLRLKEVDQVGVHMDQLIYLNRLSDWLFLLARDFNFRAQLQDVEWKKGP